MKLFFSHASPFARKCRIVLRLKGLLSQFDEIEATPLQNPSELLAANPIAQVPAMILDNGVAISDSPLICAYLDRIGKGESLYGDNDLESRRIETLGDAIMETAVKIRMEQIRPPNEQSPNWIARWHDNLLRALFVAEKEIESNQSEAINIGIISIVCALSYLDLRFKELDWANNFPKLMALQDKFEAEGEFIATFPK